MNLWKNSNIINCNISETIHTHNTFILECIRLLSFSWPLLTINSNFKNAIIVSFKWYEMTAEWMQSANLFLTLSLSEWVYSVCMFCVIPFHCLKQLIFERVKWVTETRRLNYVHADGIHRRFHIFSVNVCLENMSIDGSMVSELMCIIYIYKYESHTISKFSKNRNEKAFGWCLYLIKLSCNS